jgi:enamine deaminase RidA (YjgF/YER057c/UK114 family)
VGDWVVVSGIPAGGEGTYEEKIRRMYERAGELLEASGASFADVVELTSFHAESTSPEELQAEFQRYMPIHREFFGDHRPAWTAVGTTTLLSSTAVVELRIVAVAGSGAGATVVPAGGGRVDEVSMEPPAEP